ncbi:MAG: two-component hybrid sensor and regulator [Acidobacteria bacterium]|nr:two-component hybrid sensor and regulator [Acidobacteriota bacterium]
MPATGIHLIGEVPWGTHFCQFYEDERDLVDLLVPYFEAGLAHDELCMWITSAPLQVEEATAALRRAGVDVEAYTRAGQLKILDHRDWYLRGGRFDAARVLRDWESELDAGVARGFEGLRLSGNTFWLEQSLWHDFTEYEAAVDEVIRRLPMLALCTYSLRRCGAIEILDVMSNHAFALIKRAGRWQVIESAERKKIEASLRTSEERYRSLFNGMAEGFALHEIVCDAEGRPSDYRFLDINPAFERLTGLRRDQVVGRLMSEVLPDEDRAWVEKYGRVALTGEVVHFDNFAPTLDRHYEVFSYRPAPGQFAVIFHDVTELKLAEARLAEANRLKDEFLANLSHELRTPLNAILGWAELLSQREFDAETTRRAIQTIARNAKAQAQLVSDVLDLSRIVAGRTRLTLQDTDLGPIVLQAMETIRPAAEAKGVAVDADLPSSPVVVSGDPDRLQQVFWNLLSNAVKFTPAGGRVGVRVRRADRFAGVEVRDSGAGIAPAFLPFVFDRFSQRDTSSSRRHGGLGLGLAIVRHLVELHGGSVQAASEGEGAGSVFTVSLPVRQAAANAAGGAASAPEGAAPAVVPLAGIAVVVVDDEADARELVRTVLEQEGAAVRVAGSAAEALALLREQVPDLLVADIGMPGEDGYALIRRVRAGEDCRIARLPAVALTAYGRDEDRLRVLQAGFQQHVAKPLLPGELVAVAASLVRLSPDAARAVAGGGRPAAGRPPGGHLSS